MKWLNQLFSRRRRYTELSESIQEHLEEKVADLMEDGMPQKQAEQKARREFGNVTQIQERSREVWQWSAIESMAADLKFAFRRLGKSPGFAATVILTLAIGIGANTAVFSVLNSVLLKPLPYPEPERLVALRLTAPGAEGLAQFRDELRLSPSMYLTFAAHNKSFQSMGVWRPGTASITGIAQPEQVNTAVVTDGVLQTFNVQAAAGHWLTVADQDPHGTQRVMLSYGYWQRRFGGDPRAVGRTIQVDNVPHEIAGVMPRGFKIGSYDFDVMVPRAFDPVKQQLAGFAFRGVARLRPGVSIADANADLSRLLNVWMNSWSNGPGTNSHFYEIWRITPALRPMKDQVIGSIGNVLWVVMATIGLVMLIACTNIANLLLVRADGRQQELAIRAALGAGRGRIARELLLESVMLGVLGGLAGVGVAYAGLRLLTAIGPQNLPRLSEISLDGWSLVFTLGLSVLCGLMCGAIPVLRYARLGQGAQVPGGMRTMSASRERQRGRNVLVVAQVAMALVLLVSASLMIRTFYAMNHVDPGFAEPGSLQVMLISIPDKLIHDPQTVTQVQKSIQEKLAAIPGVSSAGFAAAAPMTGAEPDWDQVFPEGKDYGGEVPPLRLFNYAGPGYFHTTGTIVIAGREFTWTDVQGMRQVVLVSDGLARELWGSAQAAVGKRLKEFPNTPWFEVIGVVQDIRDNGLDQVSPATVYWPTIMSDVYGPGLPGVRTTAYFVMRTKRAGTQALVNDMQQAVWSVNSNLPVADISTMQEIYNQSLARTSFTLVMLAIAGAMALLLGIIGIYGVISYAVSQRTREIGIRLALGAQKGELKWMFVRSALVLTGVGVVIGVAAAAGLTQFMKSLLFGISPLDPFTYAAIPFILILSAVLAGYLPARRAAAVDPVEALRAE